MKLLFVCTGNSCRSVMAEYLLRKLAQERGLSGWEARSCGIAAEKHFLPPPEVHAVLAGRGVREVKHVPQLVGRALLQWADLILPMARVHREYLLENYPESKAKIKLFWEEASGLAQDVEDPIGKTADVYESCRVQIERGLAAILDKHAGAPK